MKTPSFMSLGVWREDMKQSRRRPRTFWSIYLRIRIFRDKVGIACLTCWVKMPLGRGIWCWLGLNRF